jgi:hypothetical protein
LWATAGLLVFGRWKIATNPASRISRRTRLRLPTWPWVASHAAIRREP